MLSSDLAKVGADVDKAMRAARKGLSASLRPALAEAGKTAKVELERAASGVVGGDLRPGRLQRLTVRQRVNGDTLTVSPRGPWGLFQPGAVPHVIRPRRRRALVWSGGAAAAVRHPGTPNRRVWDKGQTATERVVFPVIADEIGGRVEEGFSG